MATAASYVGFRFPAEVISHAVWLYYPFALSFRDVSELMLARGVVVSHETIRQWTRKFGQTYANELRRRRPRPGGRPKGHQSRRAPGRVQGPKRAGRRFDHRR